MKKFTPLLLSFVLIFAFSNLHATKKDSIIAIVSPAPGSNINAWVNVHYTVAIKNVGTEAMTSSDLVTFMAAFVSGSNITPFLTANIYKALAVGDTFHYTVTFSIKGTTSGQLILFFGIAMDAKTFSGMEGAFNFVGTGIEEYAKTINNVYFNNGSLYVKLDSKLDQDAKLNITNLNGQIIFNRDLHLKSDNVNTDIFELGMLSKGIYIVSIVTSYGVDTKKFVVQ